ncbi:MAG: HdeD family acid-resistance protein [Planctomycetaceae bacterium]|nr:HdeD family acid-resistance protein [Planctomycetaceae bacterium]
MVIVLARNWWALVLRGLFAVLFGIIALVWPGITLGALVLLYGAYALADGVFAIASVMAGRTWGRPWWSLLVEGLVGIAVGIMTFAWPGITALVLLYLIAAWAFVTGIFEIVAAIRLREEIRGEWLLALSGILSVLFGVALVIWPGAGALALIWVIGAYAIAFGVLMIALGFRLRSWSRRESIRATSPSSDPTAAHRSANAAR